MHDMIGRACVCMYVCTYVCEERDGRNEKKPKNSERYID